MSPAGSRPIGDGRWVEVVARSYLSLALVAAILALALPAAFGGGVWGGGVDPALFF